MHLGHPGRLIDLRERARGFPGSLHRSHKHKKLLVVGTPKGGTRHMAKVMAACGLRVRHEDMGEDGSVSCFLAVDDYYYHGRHHDRLAICSFDVRMHQTREPLGTIGSLTEFEKTWFWHWQEKHTGVPGDEEPLLRAASFYEKWHGICEQEHTDLRFRVEDLHGAWPQIKDLLKLSNDAPPLPATAHSIGASEHVEVTWDDIKGLDVALYDSIRRRAERYGYEV